MRLFGPSRSSPYTDTSLEPYPSEPEPVPEHQESHYTEHDQEHEHEQEHSQGPEEHLPEENPTTPPGPEQPEHENTGELYQVFKVRLLNWFTCGLVL